MKLMKFQLKKYIQFNCLWDCQQQNLPGAVELTHRRNSLNAMKLRLRYYKKIHMARGARSKGRLGRHRTGRIRLHSSHPHYGRGQDVVNGAAILETVMDAIAARTGQPKFFKGALFISGAERLVINQLDNFSSFQPQFYQDPFAMMDLSAMTGMMQQPPLNNNPLNTMTNQPFMQESLPGNMVPMEQMTIDTSFLNPNMGYPPSQPQMMMPPQPMVMPTSFAKVDITAIGNKTSAYNCLVYTLTYVLSGCLIIPLFFMSCMWWKKIVYPKYELNIEFYRSIGRYLRSNPLCIELAINVCDNAFDGNKARVLYQSLQGSGVRTFTFANQALPCNYNGSEADNFVSNMAQIKSLPIKSTFTWGNMTV